MAIALSLPLIEPLSVIESGQVWTAASQIVELQTSAVTCTSAPCRDAFGQFTLLLAMWACLGQQLMVCSRWVE